MSQPITDIHCHVIPGIDDGPGSLAETIELLKISHCSGVRGVVATPHMFLEPFDNFEPADVMAPFETLKTRLAEYANHPRYAFLQDLQLSLGAENYASPDFLQALARREIVTMGGGRYVLVEFPQLISLRQLQAVVEKIQAQGLVPILAHVERYAVFQKKPQQLGHFLERGCLSQVNLGSFFESRWSRRGRMIRILLKADLISIIASDSHGPRMRPPDFERLRKKLPLGLTEESFSRLCSRNPAWVVGR